MRRSPKLCQLTLQCACGCELQRDTNAAINILNLAKA
ncbi:hypothetical protein DP117_05325 [Brasilonema sp. UFV-L1]|nr:hypothetical protein [Brasilonema sp. UFV-L1]